MEFSYSFGVAIALMKVCITRTVLIAAAMVVILSITINGRDRGG